MANAKVLAVEEREKAIDAELYPAQPDDSGKKKRRSKAERAADMQERPAAPEASEGESS